MNVIAKVKYFLLLLLPFQSAMAQFVLPDFQTNATAKDSVRKKQILEYTAPYDFSIAVSVHSFWSRDTTYYKVLTRKAGQWSAAFLKISGERDNPPQQIIAIETEPVEQKYCDHIFALLELSRLFTLNNDSLNNDSSYQKHPVMDAAYYTFLVRTKGKLRVINAYAPHSYYDNHPDLPGTTERKYFIDCLDFFYKLFR